MNPREKPGSETWPSGGKRILIVEDETIISHDISNRLQALGYSIIGIEVSGEQAIERAREEKPDMVMMDIVLQGKMDGIEAAGEIRSRLNIPVIYLTAYTDEKILERAKITEPFGYLIKPFEDKEMHFAIETSLYRHKMAEELRKTKEQFQTLLESSNAIPWELDLLSKRFTYVGPQAERILGYPLKRWKDFDFWASLIHPEDRDEAANYFTESTARSEDHEFEYRAIAADGREVWLRDIVSVIEGEDGRKALCGFMLDITKRKQAEMERESLISELQEALARIKTLSGLLPICAWCKKIRDDKGYWTQVETYLKERSGAEFTHGICPECKSKVQKEVEDLKKEE
jgi:PAS domain S-box-containing protein